MCFVYSEICHGLCINIEITIIVIQSFVDKAVFAVENKVRIVIFLKTQDSSAGIHINNVSDMIKISDRGISAVRRYDHFAEYRTWQQNVVIASESIRQIVDAERVCESFCRKLAVVVSLLIRKRESCGVYGIFPFSVSEQIIRCRGKRVRILEAYYPVLALDLFVLLQYLRILSRDPEKEP